MRLDLGLAAIIGGVCGAILCSYLTPSQAEVQALHRALVEVSQQSGECSAELERRNRQVLAWERVISEAAPACNALVDLQPVARRGQR